MYPRSYFPNSYFPPSFWPKAGTLKLVGAAGAGGGQIFDMQSWFPTDQMLDFPDFVYSIPPAETQPVEETTIIVGTVSRTGIQITGTLEP